MISIVIPVKNGGDDLRRCLEAIRAQEMADDVETVVVDSGSSDGSDALAESLGARVHRIPPEEFFLDYLYGPRARVQRAASEAALSMETTLFSNVNSAMRREVFERFPFVEDINMSEDQEWSRRVLLAGYAIVYEPRAVVRHSHDYDVRAAFRRFYESGFSSRRAYAPGGRSLLVVARTGLDYARAEARWLRARGQLRWLPYAVVYEGAKGAGLVTGTVHDRWRSRSA